MSSFVDDEKVISTHTINIPSKSNQDRGIHFTITGFEIWITVDGHGVNGDKFADLTISYLVSRFNDGSLNLEVDDLTETMTLLLNQLNEEARVQYGSVRGGNTLSILIKRQNDWWIINLGDSAIGLLDFEKSSFEILSEDHGPSNIHEAERILKDFPNAIFEYDRVNKRLPVMPLYSKEEEKIVRLEPKENCYFKNRMCETATYVGYDPINKVALTRGIGDFSFQEKIGLSCIPYVRKIDVTDSKKIILCASDGFWDCWTHDEIIDFFKTRDVKELDDIHFTKAQHYFGSNKDDSFIHVISIV